MTKHTTKARRKKTSASKSRQHAMQDRGFYFGFIMIGGFIVLLSIPLTGGDYWRHTALFCFLLLVILINLAAWKAYAGGKLLSWQAALARIPLRAVGYGSKGGKPVEAAHDKPDAKLAIWLCLVISLVLLGGLAVLLIPGLWP